eukprot:TRINITY_DN16871_c0_g1_i2.p1 TRINITY_DN16871_c0_g1~~TRINITY_DN16871_c0_g1_i2.p1  ORF type:complete len:111 (-),score=15.95 TRINITY_DN16871_c0_g1_i2:217-549(-)
MIINKPQMKSAARPEEENNIPQREKDERQERNQMYRGSIEDVMALYLSRCDAALSQRIREAGYIRSIVFGTYGLVLSIFQVFFALLWPHFEEEVLALLNHLQTYARDLVL